MSAVVSYNSSVKGGTCPASPVSTTCVHQKPRQHPRPGCSMTRNTLGAPPLTIRIFVDVSVNGKPVFSAWYRARRTIFPPGSGFETSQGCPWYKRRLCVRAGGRDGGGGGGGSSCYHVILLLCYRVIVLPRYRDSHRYFLTLLGDAVTSIACPRSGEQLQREISIITESGEWGARKQSMVVKSRLGFQNGESAYIKNVIVAVR